MYGAIASGGFASVHLGRSVGAGGFAKLVAIKRLHSQFVADPDVTKMFLDEARLVARVQHPNVVPTIDFIEEEGELFMVMEYVEGVTLGHVLLDLHKKRRKLPLDIVLRIMTGMLQGLHAAHEATDERGQNLGVIHRDVSPDNVLIGVDGHARLLDFGVARALGRFHSTREGDVKGKLWYMTPEQVSGKPLSRRTDLFAASVVLWQCLTGRRLFDGEHLGELALKVSQQEIEPPSKYNRAINERCDQIVMRGLERDPRDRWNTAEDMAEALDALGKIATPGRVGRWIKMNAKERLEKRTAEVSAVELTPAHATEHSGTHSSGGEESFSAATEVVVRPPIETAQGTAILEQAELASHEPSDAVTPVTPAPANARRANPMAASDDIDVDLGSPDDDIPKVQIAAQVRALPSEPELPQVVAKAPAPDPMVEQALLVEMARTNELALQGVSRRRGVTIGVALAGLALVGVVVFAATSMDEPSVGPASTSGVSPVAPVSAAPALAESSGALSPSADAAPSAEASPSAEAASDDAEPEASAAPVEEDVPPPVASKPAPVTKTPPAKVYQPPRPYTPKPKPKKEESLFSRD
jgi:serine/threonine-protein kinase